MVPSTVRATLVPSAVSKTVGVAKVQAVPHSTTWLPPHVSSGGVVSTTVKDWLHLELLVQWSLACQVRVALKVFPEKPAVFVVVPTIEIITLVPSQASVADGGAKFQVVPYSTVWLGEQ